MASAASSTFQGYGDASGISSFHWVLKPGNRKYLLLLGISWLSVSISRDKWHVFKWFVIDSLQSSRRTDSVTPLELPHVPLYFDKQDKKHEVSIMYSRCKFKSTRDTTKNTNDKWLLLTLKNNLIIFFLAWLWLFCQCCFFKPVVH